MTLSGTLSTPQGMSGMLSLSAGTDPTLSREGVAADAKAVGELKADIIEDTVSGPIANITDAKAGAVNSLEIAITPKQAGSGDPSPTNIRTISGWTGANIYRAGKNLLPKFTSASSSGIIFTVNADGSVSVSGKSTAGNVSTNFWLPDELVKMLAGKTVTLSGGGSSSAYIQFRLVATTTTYQTTAATGSRTFTVPAGVTQIRADIAVPTNGTTVASGTVFYPQLELGSTATAYEPYAVTTKSISFGQTVYGGTLNVTTGELTVTHGYIGSYAGETLPGKWISDKAVYAAGTTPPNGAQVVYELASSTTYQLTPTEIITLLGDNNIWADCGDVEVEYKCDTKRYIQKLTMPTEDDMTANQNIASGKFFMIGNSLYYSTASIANGAKIIVGTNCNRVSLADALNNINS